jgi:hypothetical protein
MLLNTTQYYPNKVLFSPILSILPDQEAQVTGHIVSGFESSPMNFRHQLLRDRDRVFGGRSQPFCLIFSHLLVDVTEYYFKDMPRKPKQPEPIRTHVSLSFTCPFELEEPMNQAAAAKGMNRSQYICWLVQQDIYFQARTPPLGDGKTLLPKVPPRIRRKSS